MILPYAFSSIVFPLSILVTINFWAIYSYYPRVIDEDNVTESFFPSWVNHGLHTTILLLACIEKFITYRSYPTKIQGFLGLSTVLTLYCLTCTILYLIGGVWPYPLVSLLSKWHLLIYIYGNYLFGFFIMRLGESINNKIWSKNLFLNT
ncbi:Androgen-induced protein, putative [Pediculus humanus corporis]|uniref:Androgen-induced protein, putative n=1 Tax=Pediculus humanus subsp. corporis TaxID=121224 RepID=E0VFL4_PEDHC|nr:Androgen-induced protein, putative [Pediculus humanus corporis]EEB12170.1 Androgen-induced protein, putative [Pediculus humanus corporis]